MKKLYTTLLLLTALLTASAQNTPTSQMEKLDRGLVAVSTSDGIYLSWRLLGTDDELTTTFDIIRNGDVIDEGVYLTNYLDKVRGASYQIAVKVNGEEVERSKTVTPWNKYLSLTLDRPATGTGSCTYSPNDCSVGDVDGDGEYELFVKWDPSNSQDNSKNGYTGNVYIDCYKLDGTKLWRIDLGKNIRAGAHYTQFQVYDFDGDGRAELMCKTAPGSKDGKGVYVNQAATLDAIKAADNTKDWRNSNGRVNGGQEYLTVFDGQDGHAIHTIAYWPNRNAKAELSEGEGTFNWDDRSGKTDKGSYGNRGERYLAATAYLDGPDGNASGIFCRGYYTYAYIWAVDFDGQLLHPRWLHRSDSHTQWSVVGADGKETDKVTAPTSWAREGRNTMYGNGNHNLSLADVDGDGKDEIIWGSAALDDDGRLLYSVGFGHGDAIHLGDLDPDRPGLELFDIHEDGGRYPWDVHDAATGKIIWQGGQERVDNGRGCAADIVASNRGYEFWSSYGGFENNTNYVKDSPVEGEKPSRNQNPFNVQTGTQVGSSKVSMNFRIYWDGDLQDELLDGTAITKYGGSTLKVDDTEIASLGSPSSCNSTKATPCLSADILGDWREELILWSTTDYATLNIYTTTTATNYRMPTLMHDHTYRMGICWQNTAYNQPPHLGYYLPDAMLPTIVGDKELTVNMGEAVNWTVKARYAQYMSITRSKMPSGLKRTIELGAAVATITGSIAQEGDYTIPVSITGRNNEEVEEQLTIHVVNTTGIHNVQRSTEAVGRQVYDLQGRQHSGLKRGLNIIREGGKARKVIGK